MEYDRFEMKKDVYEYFQLPRDVYQVGVTMAVLAMNILQHQPSLLTVYASQLFFVKYLRVYFYSFRPGFAGSRCEIGKRDFFHLSNGILANFH